MEVSTGSDRRHWAGSYLPGAATHSIGAVHVPASSGGGGRQWRSHATRDLQLRGHGAAKKTRLCGGTTTQVVGDEAGRIARGPCCHYGIMG
jgi:hypothetical protein